MSCTIFNSYELRPCNVIFTDRSGNEIDVNLTDAIVVERSGVIFLKSSTGGVSIDMSSPPDEAGTPLTLQILVDAIDACKEAIPALDASDITSGVFDVDRIPTGVPRGLHYLVPLPSGSYVTATMNGGGNTNAANAVNRLQAYPFWPSLDMTVDAIVSEVSTLHAANFQMGIYSDTGSFYPNAIIKETGEISAGSNGMKVGTWLGGGSTVLSAGTIYWLAIHSNTTATFRGIVTGLWTWGEVSTASLNNTYRTCFSTTATAYSALGMPATFPAAIASTYATATTLALRLA